MRLDSTCFNLGFGSTIAHARQLVNHGHITVNGKVIDVASFQCRVNDKIGIKPKIVSKNIVEQNLKTMKFLERPSHLKFDSEKMEGQITHYCERNDLLLELDELLVIEYYSRR